MIHGTNAPAAATDAATATSAADLTGVFAIGEEGGLAVGEEGGLAAASRLEGDAGTAAGADGFFETAGMVGIPAAPQHVVRSLNLRHTHPTKQYRSPARAQCSLPPPPTHPKPTRSAHTRAQVNL